ncbi:MAM and LDL-receptor class A domain-containing protein 1-like protein, partial [Leptotrombidium deliense]
VSGNQGDQWNEVTINIGQQRRFDVFFEAIFGEGKGPKDFALDDLRLFDCEPKFSDTCKADEIVCKDNSKCIKVWQKCDGIYNCIDKSDETNCIQNYGSCDFNDENWLQKCRWNNFGGDFEWETATKSNSNKTGPQSSITDEDRETIKSSIFKRSVKLEQFLYINSSGKETGEEASIITPEFPASTDVCHLSYFFYMFGSQNMGTLRIYTISNDNETNELITQLNSNFGPKWFHASHVINREKPFRVVFQGVVGESGLSDIAIDEVRFSENCFDASIPITPTNCTGFLCNDGFCLEDLSLVCNCEKDCIDGSDELSCDINCCKIEFRKFLIAIFNVVFYFFKASNILNISTTAAPVSQHSKKGKAYPYSVISMGIISLVILFAAVIVVIVRKSDFCDSSPTTFENPVYAFRTENDEEVVQVH